MHKLYYINYISHYRNYEGKRSLEDEKEFPINTKELQSFDATVPVEPFNMEERVRAIHERRRRQSCPGPNDSEDNIRYVLFIVDASGSIGRDFERVKMVLANISELLCGNVRVAMITYTSVINLEFCFDCYTDRSYIADAILRARTVGGWTHTTDATKCACETMLTEECGLPLGIRTKNIDVVYFTDGRHNGPCRSHLGNELLCLHQRRNINTTAIAVGDAAVESVQDLENPENLGHIFDVDNIDELVSLFKDMLEILNIRNSDGSPKYTCFLHDRACRKK